MSQAVGLTRVDFEIAFTALLAAAVTTYASPDLVLYPWVEGFAIGLLALTVARRIAVINGLTGDQALLAMSTYVMDAFSYVALLYLSYILSRSLIEVTGLAFAPPHVFGVLTPVLAVGVLIGQELVFQDAFQESERIFQAKSEEHRGSVFGGFLSKLAAYVGSRRLDTWHDQIEQAELTDFREQRTIADLSEDEIWYLFRSTVVFLVGSILLPIGTYAGLFIGGTFLWTAHWLTVLSLLIATITVSGLVSIWYSQYGIVNVEQRNGYYHLLSVVFTYLFTGFLIFP